MNRSVWAVAKWEFGRYYKLRDQLIGMLSLLIGGSIGIGAVKLSDATSGVKVAVVAPDLELSLPNKSKIQLVRTEDSIDQVREKVLNREFDGALVPIENPSPEDSKTTPQIELLVRSEPTWLDEIQIALNQLQTQKRIASTAMPPEQIASIFAPAELRVTQLNNSGVNKLDRLAAMLMLGLMILTSWLGLAYFMTGISGEKQQRVTEQIVSAISPQAWVDGKLIGLTGAAIGSTANLVLTGVLSWIAARMFGYEVPLPASLSRFDLLPWIAIYVVGGVFLWNCFYASVAAIINDPNSSARSSLMFLPILPMATAAFAMSQPDGTWMRLLSVLPGSSSTAMPIRLLLGDVAMWELALSMLAMGCGILLLRTIAGRIFAAGIMLTGKEPSWFDVARWVVEGKNASRQVSQT